MKIVRMCPMCGTVEERELNITAEQIQLYADRKGFIQVIFPDLSASEREFIKTGYCFDCQEMLFAPME